MLTTPEAPPAGWLNIIPELLLVALSILTVAGNLAIPPISKLLSIYATCYYQNSYHYKLHKDLKPVAPSIPR